MTVNETTRENLHTLLDVVMDAIDSDEPTVLFMVNDKIVHLHARKKKRFSDNGWDVSMTFKEEITAEDVKKALDALEKTKKGVSV